MSTARRLEVLEGNCVERMRAMPEASVDAVVCDPPYGLEFMGKAWDRLDGDVLEDPASAGGFQDGNGGNPYSRSRIRYGGVGQAHADARQRRAAEIDDPSKGKYIRFGVNSYGADTGAMQRWHEDWAREALRVARPGAFLVAFGGTRTFHRLACALENAGWEVLDCLGWLYGSGFPKSHDVAKAIDRAAGAEREKLDGAYTGTGYTRANVEQGECQRTVWAWARVSSEAATEAARPWQGWGTALKPAWEPIILARKPLEGDVA